MFLLFSTKSLVYKLKSVSEHHSTKLITGSILLLCTVLISTGVVLLGQSLKCFHSEPLSSSYLEIIANRTSAKVILFSLEYGCQHDFDVDFHSDAGNPVQCEFEDDTCLQWSNENKLIISKNQLTNVYSMTIISFDKSQLCFPLHGIHLYGGPIGENWPSEYNIKTNSPYISGMGGTGSVAVRKWLTSNGLLIKVDSKSPLFVSQNPNELCLTSKHSFPFQFTSQSKLNLTVFLKQGPNPKIVLQSDPKTKFRVPFEMIQWPVWSTWPYLKRSLNQTNVLKFAHNILLYGLSGSVMEIDDGWESCYGSFEFDRDKFPEPKHMVSHLKSLRFNVTLRVHPFVNIECSLYDSFKPHLVKHSNQSILLTHWSRGLAAIVDFRQQATVDWFSNRLTNLRRRFDVDNFKFDLGEEAYIYRNHFGRVFSDNVYTDNYVKLASTFGAGGQIQVGQDSSSAKLFQRTPDSDSHWVSTKNGLTSLIGFVLQLSLLGHSAVITDPVGGNARTSTPTKELYIRWLQSVTFLPVMKFSIPPWEYDDETLQLTKNYIKLHQKFSKLILNEIQNPTPDNRQVINPIWWLSPNDQIALTEYSEFLLGDQVLVAPVLTEGSTQRNIYLPSGLWKDGNHLHSSPIKGPGYVTNYSVPLHVLPFFINLDNKSR